MQIIFKQVIRIKVFLNIQKIVIQLNFELDMGIRK